MKSKVFLFNGPPRSGKDTACDELYLKHSRVVPMKFAKPLHDFARSLINPGEIEYYTNEGKNEIIPHLRKSYRDVCINLSERYAKGEYGFDIFGRAFVERAKWWIEDGFIDGVNFVVSDSGFASEIRPLVDFFGKENIILIRIERDGCSYIGDSRSYIDLSEYGIEPILIKNDNLADFKQQINEIYRQHGQKSLG